MIHEAGGPRIRGQQNKKESVAVTDFEVEGAQEKKEKKDSPGTFSKVSAILSLLLTCYLFLSRRTMAFASSHAL